MLRRLTIAFALSGLASGATALDLMQAYDAALANDPTFRMAVKEYEAGLANRTIGRSAVLPKLGLNYNQFANDSAISGPVVTGGPSQSVHRSYPSDMVGVQLTQPLFNLAALAQMRQGMAQGDRSEAVFHSSTQELLVRVMQGYVDVLFAQDNLEALEAESRAYHEQLALNKRSFEKGEGTITDTLESRSSYEISEAQIIEARDTLELSKRKLEVLIGDPIKSPKDLVRLGRQFRTKDLIPSAFELWREMAMSNNPEIRASEHAVEVARQEYEKQKAAHYPVVSAVAGWSQQKSQTYVAINQNAINSQVGVQISMPIFAGGEISGKSTQSMANYEKAQAERDQVRDRVLTELRKQYDLVRSARQRVDVLSRAVESATELTKAMRQSIRGGQRVNLDALVADRKLANTRRDLAQAKYNYLLSGLRLKQMAGNLELTDFRFAATNFNRN